VTSWNVYPNPTTGKITLTFNANGDSKYRIKVSDVLGNVLKTDWVIAVEGFNSKEISLENFTQGIYFVALQFEEKTEKTLRIILQR